MSEGRKDDSGKTRYDLVTPYGMDAVADVYTMGAEKYEDRNWEKGIKFGRVFAAIMRHLWKFWMGQDVDGESGLPHLAHAAWGCMALLHYTLHPTRDYGEFDDRPNKEVK